MTLRRILSFTSKALIAAALIVCALLLYECHRINEHIDRCADDSSNDYITDDALRAKECAKDGY